MLKVENLTKTFGGVHAVDNVSFESAPQGIIAIIGPNGAGKSTLLNLIGGLIAPLSGKIFYKDEDITHLPIEARARKGIGKSFQIVSLFPGLTVREHILIAVNKDWLKRSYSKQEVETANNMLVTLGMADNADAVVRSLSISEHRRLDIGMLLTRNSELLLLDEPFAGLASDQIDDLEASLLNIAKEKAIIVVEHRMSIVMELASRLLVMVEGKVIADGTPDEIRQNKQVQKAYLREEL